MILSQFYWLFYIVPIFISHTIKIMQELTQSRQTFDWSSDSTSFLVLHFQL